jgi:hypothetical protein
MLKSNPGEIKDQLGELEGHGAAAELRFTPPVELTLKICMLILDLWGLIGILLLLMLALWSSNGNNMETKAERSFDLDFVFDIEAIEPAYSRTCKDRSEANPAYSTP